MHTKVYLHSNCNLMYSEEYFFITVILGIPKYICIITVIVGMPQCDSIPTVIFCIPKYICIITVILCTPKYICIITVILCIPKYICITTVILCTPKYNRTITVISCIHWKKTNDVKVPNLSSITVPVVFIIVSLTELISGCFHALFMHILSFKFLFCPRWPDAWLT